MEFYPGGVFVVCVAYVALSALLIYILQVAGVSPCAALCTSLYIVYKLLYIMADLNRSFNRLQMLDIDDLDDVQACQERWIDEVKKKLNCEEDDLTAEKFSGPTKVVSSRWLAEAREIICRQRDVMVGMQEIIELLKTEALGDKGTVIRLQSELLERKDEQLKSLQTVVQTTVQDTVQAEIRTYGDALKTPSAVISPATVKKVVQDVIKDGDRSKNLLVFGLAEKDGEQLDEMISDVFMELGEKPRVAAIRLGRKSPGVGTSCRPVKVTLASSTAVRQILTKTRNLRQLERLKAVYVSPDRSPVERAARRQLVLELKKKIAEQSDRKHYIKGGKVCSEDKTVT